MWHVVTVAGEEQADRDAAEMTRRAMEQPEHPAITAANRANEERLRRIQAYRHENGLTDPRTGRVPPAPDDPDEPRA